MAAMVYDTVPAGWDDSGEYALSEKGKQFLIGEISKRLPDVIDWCGDELLVEEEDLDKISDDFYIQDVIDKAWAVVLNSTDMSLWADE